MADHPNTGTHHNPKQVGLQRANILGEGTDETQEPEGERTEVNPLGKEDRNARDLSPNKFLIDDNKNTKPRRASHGAIPSET